MCNCKKELEQRILKEYNADRVMLFTMDSVEIRHAKENNKRKNGVTIGFNYCPMCGVRLTNSHNVSESD